MRPAVLQPVLVSSVLLASRYLALSREQRWFVWSFTLDLHFPLPLRRSNVWSPLKLGGGILRTPPSKVNLDAKKTVARFVWPSIGPTAFPDVFRNLNLHECAIFFCEIQCSCRKLVDQRSAASLYVAPINAALVGWPTPPRRGTCEADFRRPRF